MTLAPPPHVVIVEAPDGPSALTLERRLAHLSPVSIARDDHWIVEVPEVDAPEEIEAAIRTWLTEIGSTHTVVKIDGRRSRIEVSPRSHGRHIPTNAEFVG